MGTLEDLRDLLKVQGANGNWDYSPYMHGLYNGLALAVGVMEGREPEFRQAPGEWLWMKGLDAPHLPVASHG